MSHLGSSSTFALGDRSVKRLGYGAMQLAGAGVFGPPRDRDAAPMCQPEPIHWLVELNSFSEPEIQEY